MTKVVIQDEISTKNPSVRLGCISCSVNPLPSDEKIKSFSKTIVEHIQSALTLETVSQKPTIKSTKEAYRKLGKDPSRYRPSAEALMRRIVNGKELYWINNIVDVLNLISLESGFSIGGYDAEKINGAIKFGVGKANEPYEAIGRGNLNIENLPLFRDEIGAFGSPTSDSMRTMVTDQTIRFLMILIDFEGHEMLEKTMERSVALYRQYTNAHDIETEIISATA